MSVTFNNGAIQLVVKKDGGIYDLENIISTRVSAQPGKPGQAILTIEMVIDKAVFRPAPFTYEDADWQKLKDIASVFGFEPGSNNIAKNNKFEYVINDQNPGDFILGNQVSVIYTDSKIGGAG